MLERINGVNVKIKSLPVLFQFSILLFGAMGCAEPCQSDNDCGDGFKCSQDKVCVSNAPPGGNSSTAATSGGGGECKEALITVDVFPNNASFNKVGNSPGEVLCVADIETPQQPFYGVTFQVINVGNTPIKIIPGSCWVPTPGSSSATCTESSTLGGYLVDCPVNNQPGLQTTNASLVCDVANVNFDSATDTSIVAVEVQEGSCPAELDSDEYHVQGVGF